MSNPDLILLHAPSVYDFRREAILHGPVSDLVPSTAVFEMYPIGFASIADYLERHGFQVRIVNLAVRMLNNPKFDAEKMIRKLEAPLFGIDLHWLVHAHGSLEIAEMVKKHHPKSKIVFGGLSSTYFYYELMNHYGVDFVMRGDTTEEPLRQLLTCIKQGIEPESVANLVWRDKQGKMQENPVTHVPANLNDVMTGHYTNIVRSVLRYRDLASYIPFRNWREYPITAIFTCRGCSQNCVICGGSSAAFRKFYHRPDCVVFRSPEAVINDIKQINRFSNGPIFILGDLRQPGEDYGYDVLRRIKEAHVKNQVIMELFEPAKTEFLRQMGDSCPKFCLQMSPESHDPVVRKASGKNYSNEDLERTLGDALNAGCSRLDIFFMIGLPQQTPQSVMETVDYGEYLLKKFHGDKRLALYIGPLAPFLDPGSLGFEQPEKFGYEIFFRSLEEHRQALLEPTWKTTLNYQTQWMTRDQIVDTTYEAILRLTRIKAKYDNISQKDAAIAEQRITSGREMIRRIDEINKNGFNEEEMNRLKPEIDRLNGLPASDQLQLQLPVGLLKIKFWNVFKLMVTGK